MADDLPTTLGGAFKQALVDAHHETVDHAHAKSADARTATMELWEQELSETIKAIGLLNFDDPNIPEPIRKLFAPVNKPENQSDFFLAILTALGLVFVGAAAAASGPAQLIENRSLEKWGDLYPDPGVVASLVVRNIINWTTGYEWAAKSGMHNIRLDRLIDAAYTHLPAGEIIQLRRRELISDADARAILKLQGLPDAEIDHLLSLVIGPIDYGTAVAAVTQSQLSPQEFQELLPEYGISRQWADVIFKTAGQSPPPELAGRLYREGWVDEALFKKMLLESPLKNEYVDLLANLRFRFPPMRTTLKMLTDHVIEAPEAQKYLEKIGFFPEDARRLIESAQKHGSTSVKNLSPSVIEKLYEVGKWDRGQAIAALEALGYDATESDLLLLLVDEHKGHQQTDRAATSIGTRYVSWKIDRSEAVTLLDRINVPSAQRDEMLEIWDARREAQTLHLSEAFLHKAFTKGNITAAEVEVRLLAMGYDAVDTKIIMATDFAAAAPKAKTKDLTRADETKRYKAGLITKAAFKDRLINAGYDATEADQIIELVDHDMAEKAAEETATNGV